MKTHSSMLHVRMDTEMKRRATVALAAMGLTASEAVAAVLPPNRGRSGFPPGTQGPECPDPTGDGRVGGDDGTGDGAIRQCGRDVCGA